MRSVTRSVNVLLLLLILGLFILSGLLCAADSVPTRGDVPCVSAPSALLNSHSAVVRDLPDVHRVAFASATDDDGVPGDGELPSTPGGGSEEPPPEAPDVTTTTEDPDATTTTTEDPDATTTTTEGPDATTTTTEDPDATTTTTEDPDATTTTTADPDATTTTTEDPDATTTTTEDPDATTTTTADPDATTTTTEGPDATTTTTEDPDATSTTTEEPEETPSTTTAEPEPTSTEAPSRPSDPPITTTTEAPSAKKSGPWWIALIVVGVLLLATGAFLLWFCCYRGGNDTDGASQRYDKVESNLNTLSTGMVPRDGSSVQLKLARVRSCDHLVIESPLRSIADVPAVPITVAGDRSRINRFTNRPYVENGVVPWTGRPPTLRGPQPACIMPTFRPDGTEIPRTERTLPGPGLEETPTVMVPIASQRKASVVEKNRLKRIVQRIQQRRRGRRQREEDDEEMVAPWYHELVYFDYVDTPDISDLDVDEEEDEEGEAEEEALEVTSVGSHEDAAVKERGGASAPSASTGHPTPVSLNMAPIQQTPSQWSQPGQQPRLYQRQQQPPMTGSSGVGGQPYIPQMPLQPRFGGAGMMPYNGMMNPLVQPPLGNPQQYQANTTHQQQQQQQQRSSVFGDPMHGFQ